MHRSLTHEFAQSTHLDRIGQRVEYHLLQACCVDEQSGRQRRLDEPTELQPLAGRHVVAEQRSGLKSLIDVVRGKVERQLPGLSKHAAIQQTHINDSRKKMNCEYRVRECACAREPVRASRVCRCRTSILL